MFENLGRAAGSYGGAGFALGFSGARRFALVTGLLTVFATSAAGADPVCSDDAIFLRAPDGTQVRFSVEIADDAPERAQGLMNRPSLAASAGMLFVYPHPKAVSFWMKNTLIPLDMLFVDSTGKVTVVHPMATPLDETGIDGGEGVQFVIEINGGMAKSLGLVPGTVLLHPVVAQADAKWPCPVQ
jgi:uncharacterized protein